MNIVYFGGGRLSLIAVSVQKNWSSSTQTHKDKSVLSLAVLINM